MSNNRKKDVVMGKQKLLALMADLGLSTKQMSDVLGVHVASFYRWRCYGANVQSRPRDLLMLLEKHRSRGLGDKLADALLTRGSLGALHALLSYEFDSPAGST